MADKMYYNEQEAADRLGITPGDLQEYVRDQRLRQFKDGDKSMYKADEVDALAGPVQADDDIVELSPADSTMDIISLSDTDISQPAGGKEDTVITAEGISIFDEEDLDYDDRADPMAKTQISPSLEDQISLEGVGSGSGLLDLTQESDDTSLGAELLDHIDLESDSVIGQALSEPDATSAFSAVPPVIGASTVTPEPTVVLMDSSAGMFAGLLVGGLVLALLIGAVTLAVMTGGSMPTYLKALDDNLWMIVFGGVVMAIVCALVGMLLGKAAASKTAV